MSSPYKMKCSHCGKEFYEDQIEESHDVPCYLFYNEIGRNNKKNRADRFGRHWLCKECHQKYEDSLNLSLKAAAIKFSKRFFGEEK